MGLKCEGSSLEKPEFEHKFMKSNERRKKGHQNYEQKMSSADGMVNPG